MILFLILSLTSGDIVTQLQEKFLSFVWQTKGIHYVYGRTDCSWLVKRWFNHLGLYLPRGSWIQYEYLLTQGWQRDTVGHEFGLFFFRGTNPRRPKSQISHVGILYRKELDYWMTYEARRKQGVDFYLRKLPHSKYVTEFLYNPEWHVKL